MSPGERRRASTSYSSHCDRYKLAASAGLHVFPRQFMQNHGLGFLAAVTAALALALTLAPAQAETMRLLTNQGEREAIVLPGRLGPAPTIIVLHGQTSTAAWTAENSGFSETALAYRFTAV